MTVVIPSLGLTAMLRTCIVQLQAALDELGGRGHEVVVVDNATPRPYLPSEFPGKNVQIVRLDQARSFSNACNTGARAAPNDVLLFLNNDVFLAPRSLVDLQRTMQERDAGICGARLVYPDDTIQHCGVRFGERLPGAYHEYLGRHTSTVPRTVRDFQAVTGAVMAVRQDLFAKLNGFDELFPFAYEDVDICLRARQMGTRVTCAQQVDSVHFESATPGRLDRELGSRALFEQRWRGKFTIDGVEETAG